MQYRGLITKNKIFYFLFFLRPSCTVPSVLVRGTEQWSGKSMRDVRAADRLSTMGPLVLFAVWDRTYNLMNCST